ncbi:uncharacterized protein [Dermacentor albipictus]|uniref:uncharacterized protein n=1 Tax=Dermacentor albipictus TaxID=60249 RepID=UPI0031FD5D1B
MSPSQKPSEKMSERTLPSRPQQEPQILEFARNGSNPETGHHNSTQDEAKPQPETYTAEAERTDYPPDSTVTQLLAKTKAQRRRKARVTEGYHHHSVSEEDRLHKLEAAQYQNSGCERQRPPPVKRQRTSSSSCGNDAMGEDRHSKFIGIQGMNGVVVEDRPHQKQKRAQRNLKQRGLWHMERSRYFSCQDDVTAGYSSPSTSFNAGKDQRRSAPGSLASTASLLQYGGRRPRRSVKPSPLEYIDSTRHRSCPDDVSASHSSQGTSVNKAKGQRRSAPGPLTPTSSLWEYDSTVPKSPDIAQEETFSGKTVTIPLQPAYHPEVTDAGRLVATHIEDPRKEDYAPGPHCQWRAPEACESREDNTKRIASVLQYGGRRPPRSVKSSPLEYIYSTRHRSCPDDVSASHSSQGTSVNKAQGQRRSAPGPPTPTPSLWEYDSTVPKSPDIAQEETFSGKTVTIPLQPAYHPEVTDAGRLVATHIEDPRKEDYAPGPRRQWRAPEACESREDNTAAARFEERATILRCKRSAATSSTPSDKISRDSKEPLAMRPRRGTTGTLHAEQAGREILPPPARRRYKCATDGNPGSSDTGAPCKPSVPQGNSMSVDVPSGGACEEGTAVALGSERAASRDNSFEHATEELSERRLRYRSALVVDVVLNTVGPVSQASIAMKDLTDRIRRSSTGSLSALSSQFSAILRRHTEHVPDVPLEYPHALADDINTAMVDTVRRKNVELESLMTEMERLKRRVAEYTRSADLSNQSLLEFIYEHRAYMGEQ